MAYTVREGFNTFRADVVDLAPDETKVGRASRDYLVDQIKVVAKNSATFPQLGGDYRAYGSFARRTKIRPLDDIDLLLVLNGRKTAEASASGLNTYRLKITDPTAPLAPYAEATSTFFDPAIYVNSTRVLNAIKAGLTAVPNYRKATIKRTGVAVTLALSSRSWVFDIVPAVAVTDYAGATKHYLIPDGKGRWMRTDPQIDMSNVTTANTRHSSKLLPTLRLLKYWNRRTMKPRLPSYYFETLVLKTFASGSVITDYPTAIKRFFDNGSTSLWWSCPDPKGLGPALDAAVDYTTKTKVAEAMKEAATWARYATMYDGRSDSKNAIYWWGKVFGSAFPAYGR